MRSLKRLSILFVMPLSITASQRVFIPEGGVAGFPQFGKKKITAQNLRCRANWAQKKKDPSIKYYFFEIKYSKKSLTTTLT